MTGYIDVAIPAVGGLVALAAPSLFIKEKDAETVNQKTKRIRVIGALLLLVAGIYLIVKLLAPA